MTVEFLKADFHSHPLGDCYYPGYPRELTEKDKENILTFLYSMVETEVDILACTDHNSVLSGLWAKEQARVKKLPLIIVPGAEYNVWGHTQRVHLLALNINRNLSGGQLILRSAVQEIHNQGGIAVLAHPVKYPQEINANPDILLELDGIETNNASEGIFPAEKYLSKKSYYKEKFILQTTGSDLHWEPNANISFGNSHPFFRIPVEWLLEKGIISGIDLSLIR